MPVPQHFFLSLKTFTYNIIEKTLMSFILLMMFNKASRPHRTSYITKMFSRKDMRKARVLLEESIQAAIVSN